MNKIVGLKYLKPVYGAHLPGSELLKIIKNNSCVCWLIISVTKAAGKGDNSFNLDIYLYEKCFDADELSAILEEPLIREDLILIDCTDVICIQDFRSALSNGDVVLW